MTLVVPYVMNVHIVDGCLSEEAAGASSTAVTL